MKKIKKRYIIIPIIILAIVLTTFGIVNIVNASKQANADMENNKFVSEEGQADLDKVLEGQEDVMVVPMDDETLDNVQEVSEETESEQKKETEEPKVQQTAQSSTTTAQKKQTKYFIRVNYTQNVVTIYTKDANGNYTIPYKAMICSTGKATPKSGTYTMPSGTYSRGTWGLMFGNVWAQYFTRIKGSILFHSVPYTQRNKWSLEYWEYDKLGTTASAGCVRLTVQDAKWIYDNCPSGTQVEFYSDSTPGPLGKPTAQKISSEEAVRGWDPTDPAGNNPWKTYVKEEPQVEPEVELEVEPEVEETMPVTPEQGTENKSEETKNDETVTPSETPETTPSDTTNSEETPKDDEIKTEDTLNEDTTEPSETTNPEDTSKDDEEKNEDVSKEEITSSNETEKTEDDSKEETTTTDEKNDNCIDNENNKSI